MSFSRRRYPRALRQRGRHVKTDGPKAASWKYEINWTYPTILICLVAAFVIIYLCQCAQLIGVQYRIGQLKEQRKVMLTQQKELKVAIENLESLERVEKIAMNELHMVYPGHRYMLTLKQPLNAPQTAQDDFAAVPVR